MFSGVTQVRSIYQLAPNVESLQWCKIAPSDANFSSDIANERSDVNFDRLLPTLFECFAIVFCGFLAGRCNLISPSDIKGLNDFTTYFSLPPLIFLNLVTINFSNVNWNFVLAVLLAKIVVFVLVAFVTASIHKPFNLSYAGIYAIFCTQGNDFGLAYPIVASLFGNKRPLYAGYMYLISPTSLLVTNPMGFFLMEAHRSSRASSSSSSSDDPKRRSFMLTTLLKTLSSVSWNVFKNPVVIVTIFGIIGNVLFRNGLPSVIYGVLQIFSSAFSASVLFLLGFSVVRCSSSKSVGREGLMTPAVLIIAKMLVSPLVTRSMVNILCTSAPDIDDLADYGFLYGMVPTGPIVILFATEYCIGTEMLASTMVVCTALFGPALFILVRMLTLNIHGIEEFAEELRVTVLVLSVLSIISCIWTSLCFVAGKKLKNKLYRITIFLIFSQVIMSIGVFLWAVIQRDLDWTPFLKVAFIAAGQLMTRLWITLLALTLMIGQRNKTSPFVQNVSWPMSFGFGIPLASVVMLLVLTAVGKCEPSLHKELPLFIYGSSEAVASIIVLTVCLSITVGCVVVYCRSRSQTQSIHIDNNGDDQPSSSSSSAAIDLALKPKYSSKCDNELVGGVHFALNKLTKSVSVPSFHVQDYGIQKKRENCSSGEKASGFLTQTKTEIGSGFSSSLDIVSITSDAKPDISSSDSSTFDAIDGHGGHHLRIVILLILCCVSMGIGLTISMWKLSSYQANGLFVAMEFLDAVLNVGQGIFIVIVFWRESKYVVDPLMKWLRKVRHGFYNVSEHKIDLETERLCEQFRNYHWENCSRDLPRSLLEGEESFAKCFSGQDFVEWLMKVGLADQRTMAEAYGQRLVSGGIMCSVNNAVQFHDSDSYLYELIDSCKNKS